jgi:hypothetical protein
MRLGLLRFDSTHKGIIGEILEWELARCTALKHLGI